MENLDIVKEDNYILIKATDVSPEVLIEFKDNKVSFKGYSLMSDSSRFYKNVYEIINKTIQEKSFSSLTLIYNFTYINSQSLKQIISFFYYIESLNIPVEIKWYYSDEENAELGIQLREIIEVPFKLFYLSQ